MPEAVLYLMMARVSGAWYGRRHRPPPLTGRPAVLHGFRELLPSRYQEAVIARVLFDCALPVDLTGGVERLTEAVTNGAADARSGTTLAARQGL
jgi:hypothetical protein